MSNELFKPNEFIAIIERTNVNRVARHLWNFFLMYAQREIRFAKHEGCDFEVKVTEINVHVQGVNTESLNADASEENVVVENKEENNDQQ